MICSYMMMKVVNCGDAEMTICLMTIYYTCKILRAKKRPKTRYEYNIERVRDFKVGKDQDEDRMGKVKGCRSL